MVSEDSISLLRGEWSLYQTDNEIQKSWFVENDGSYKRLDHYFAKVFELKTPSGARRYEYTRKVVKTYCSLQNEMLLWRGVFQTTKWARGVVVSMFDFHRSDRGSNPGRGGEFS